MSANYDIDLIQDYLEDLCRSNKDIAHEVGGKRTFSRLDSDEHIRQIKNNAGPCIVVVTDYRGGRVGEYDDKLMRDVLELQFAVKAVMKGDLTAAINDAIKKARNIMLQFITKMELDYENGDCAALRYFEPEKTKWEKFEGPWLDNYYGWYLSIPLKSYMPAYDATKWI